MSFLLPFLVLLLIIALFTRVDAFFSLLYVLFGVFVVGRLWSRRALRGVAVRRVHDCRAFFGQAVDVRLEVTNRGRLPVLWLRLQDSVPPALGTPGISRGGQVVSLAPRERLALTYQLRSERRGYYPIGPLTARSGDVLGSATYETRPAGEDDHSFLIVYPKIVPLHDLGFPSQSPFGTLPSRQRIFEDPTRLRGVRDYQPGDSLRRIDWKSSARVQALQVKRFEPAIALETAIFLNLDEADYALACRSTAPEMGIVVAASLAAHLTAQRQAVALATNGRDPLAIDGAARSDAEQDTGETAGAGTRRGGHAALPLRKGRQHLMNVLDLLARIEPVRTAGRPFLDLVCEQSLGLPWGSTAVLITAGAGEGLFDTLLTLRRRGLAVLLVMTCPQRDEAGTIRRAAQIGAQAHTIEIERDMDVWR